MLSYFSLRYYASQIFSHLVLVVFHFCGHGAISTLTLLISLALARDRLCLSIQRPLIFNTVGIPSRITGRSLGFEHGRKTRGPIITALLSTPSFFHHQCLEKYYISPAVRASFARQTHIPTSRSFPPSPMITYVGVAWRCSAQNMPDEQ